MNTFFDEKIKREVDLSNKFEALINESNRQGKDFLAKYIKDVKIKNSQHFADIAALIQGKDNKKEPKKKEVNMAEQP